MAAITAAQIIGEIADVAVTEYEGNQTAIEAAITTAEVDLLAEVPKLLALIPSPTGVAGMFAKPVEQAIEAAVQAAVQAAVAKYGASVLFALGDAQLKAWAKQQRG